MRILWQSNSPQTPSGYGNQTALFAPLLAQDHALTIFAYYGIEGAPLRAKGIQILPRAHDPWGNDVITAHMTATRADLLITLTDIWVLDPSVYGQLPWLAWTPIDHDPIPPRVERVLKAVRYPVAMSRFGQTQMEKLGIRADYVPHGVDTDIFKPMNRAEARAKMNWESGRFVAMMNAANKGDPSRKSFRQVLQAWQAFIQAEPNSLLYLHTDASGRQGVPLAELVAKMGLSEHVQFVDQYRYAIGAISPAELNTAYNAADVLLNPSMGEGFGIPIIEAQAAGCPVIVTDFSAMHELCFAGWTVGGVPFMTYQNAMQVLPHVGDIVTALHRAKAHQDDEALRAYAVRYAVAYDVRRVFRDYWQPLLARIAQELNAFPRVA